MMGYYGNPAATEKTIVDDWLRWLRDILVRRADASSLEIRSSFLDWSIIILSLPSLVRNAINSIFRRTGDIATYDETGQFTIVDRLKELIKVKGLQVSCT